MPRISIKRKSRSFVNGAIRLAEGGDVGYQWSNGEKPKIQLAGTSENTQTSKRASRAFNPNVDWKSREITSKTGEEGLGNDLIGSGIGLVAMPGSLPIKATTRAGKIGLEALNVANPFGGIKGIKPNKIVYDLDNPAHQAQFHINHPENSKSLIFNHQGETIYKIDPEDYQNFSTPESYKMAQKDLNQYKTKYLIRKSEENQSKLLYNRLAADEELRTIGEEKMKRSGIGDYAVKKITSGTGVGRKTTAVDNLVNNSRNETNNALNSYNAHSEFGYANFDNGQLHKKYLDALDKSIDKDAIWTNSIKAQKNANGGLIKLKR